MKTTNICPGTIATGFNTYSPSCLRKVFDGKKVSHVIDFSLDNGDENIIASVNRISISGVQEKLSAVIKKKQNNTNTRRRVREIHHQAYSRLQASTFQEQHTCKRTSNDADC